MNALLPLRAPPSRDDLAARVGLVAFIGGWTMLFAAVLVAYALLRTGARSWPPPGAPALDRAIPSLATAVLLAASAMMQLGLAAITGARSRALARSLVAALALGTTFLALLFVGWVQMRRCGLDLSVGVYAASFFGLTLLHGAHVLVGLGGIVSLLPRAFRGAFSARAHTAVRGWTVYMHFVCVAWIAVFVAVYLW